MAMSTPDMLLQGFVALICLWACWAKWGQPLWEKHLSPRRKENQRLLSRLFLDNMAQELMVPPIVVVEDVKEETSAEPEDNPTSSSDPMVTEDDAPITDDTDDTFDDVDDEDDNDDNDEPEPEEADEAGTVEGSAAILPIRPPTRGSSEPRPVHLNLGASTQSSGQSLQVAAWNAWMVRVMHEAIHLIAIGETGAGKTTVLQAFVEYLVFQGIPVVVCDPDAAAGDWPGTEIHGGGDDFKAITAALKAIQQEAVTRRQARAEGQRTFEPLWIVFDEYADIKDECQLAGTVVENLLRRARKLNIHLVIGVQDTQVKTMGFERRSALLNNARTIIIRRGTDQRRYARVDDEPAITIPTLQPAQGPAIVVAKTAVEDDPEDTDDTEDIGSEAQDLASIEDKDDQIRILLEQGQSYAQISSRLRVATTRISKVKKEFMADPKLVVDF